MKNQKGANNGNWKGGLLNMTCIVCSTSFKVKPKVLRNTGAKFCSRKCAGKFHGEEVSRNKNKHRIEKHCLICGKSIFVKPSHIDKEGKYCSKECRNSDYKHRFKGKNNPNYKGALKTCPVCGKEYINYNKKNKHCSIKCSRIAKWGDKITSNLHRKLSKEKCKNKHQKPIVGENCRVYILECNNCGSHFIQKNTNKIKYCKTCSPIVIKANHRRRSDKATLQKETKKCLYCGIEFKVFPSQPKKFCSSKCKAQGEFNANYKGGITPINAKLRRTEGQINWRIAVFERDKYTCVWCGQKGGELHADHIKPFALYPEFRLDINNGRTLCKECHKKTDSYLKNRKKEYYETS